MSTQVLKILIADDDLFVREMLCAVLESSDYFITTVENGAEALDTLISDGNFDLIISDMNMPEIDGLELIKRLRKKKIDVPIIILTGNNEISVAIEAMKSGANDYILKDENIQETILISVEKVMESYRLKLQNLQLLEDLAQKNKELERMAFLDGLTGIANRRYFETVCKKEWGRALREAKPLCVIMIDIDYFKLYNDTYGHLEGDACLKKVAGALDLTMRRSSDFVSRYGGEEFAAILPNTDIDSAIIVAENMRLNVADLKIPHSSSSVSDIITISMGISSTVPGKISGISILISMADQALYDAKKEGRDRIKTKPVSSF